MERQRPRRWRAAAAMVALALCGGGTLVVTWAVTQLAPARPAWVERLYNPPVGSRWTVTTQYRRDENDGRDSIWLAYSIVSELTIDAKAKDGFRVTLVSRNISVDGTASSAPMMRAVATTLKDIVVHASTDLAGKPLRVDNLAEVQPAMRRSIDAAAATLTDQAAKVDIFRQMLTGILIVDAEQAAAVYLDALPLLAHGHNTGLKPGEERRSVETTANPLGGEPMRSNFVLKLDTVDAASGKAQYLETESYDPVSVQNLIAEGARRLAQAQGNADPDALAQKVRDLMKSISVVRDDRTELDVEDGMTRRIQSDKNTVSRGLGVTYVKHEVKTVTVTRLP